MPETDDQTNALYLYFMRRIDSWTFRRNCLDVFHYPSLLQFRKYCSWRHLMSQDEVWRAVECITAFPGTVCIQGRHKGRSIQNRLNVFFIVSFSFIKNTEALKFKCHCRSTLTLRRSQKSLRQVNMRLSSFAYYV